MQLIVLQLLIYQQKKVDLIDGKVETTIAQKPLTILFDLLKDESGNVIGTNESNYKFKMIENTDDIESGGICLLFDVDEVSYVSFDINSELEIGTVTFKGIDKKTLYVIAEVSGYMPYHYTPIVVEAGSCGVAIIAILLVMFMLL
ncbi:Uncharacterized protein QTN25_006462 [Entamoeba marina]